MNTPNLPENPPAFPTDGLETQVYTKIYHVDGRIEERYSGGERGMSLRDWFAGKAMAGMLANHAFVDCSNNASLEYVSVAAYRFADAMLAARQEAK